MKLLTLPTKSKRILDKCYIEGSTIKLIQDGKEYTADILAVDEKRLKVVIYYEMEIPWEEINSVTEI